MQSFNNTSGYMSAVMLGELYLPAGTNLLQLQEHIHQLVSIINRGEADTILWVTSAGLLALSFQGNLLKYSVEDPLFFHSVLWNIQFSQFGFTRQINFLFTSIL